jgi:hypothetical protein
MTSYNGWTNYPTWRVNLEIFDGQSAYDITGRRGIDIFDLADCLKTQAEDLIEMTSQEGLARDYAMAFLSDVNWREIAKHLIDAEEEETEEA